MTSMLDRDKQLRHALDFALSHTIDGTAMCAIFGALGSLVQSSEDGEALHLAQRGILQLLGGFTTKAGSKITTTVLQVQTVDNDNLPEASATVPLPDWSKAALGIPLDADARMSTREVGCESCGRPLDGDPPSCLPCEIAKSLRHSPGYCCVCAVWRDERDDLGCCKVCLENGL